MNPAKSSPLRNVKIVLEYDGTDFFGFQAQPRHRTVQKVLEEALSRLHGKRIKIKSASGRTDAGVHAASQVVNFLTDRDLKPSQIVRGLNRYLPESVAVKQAEFVPADFHARFKARKKTYEYLIWNHPVRAPLRRYTTAHVPEPLNLAAMRRAASWLAGTHDFTPFCASKAQSAAACKHKDNTRTLYRLYIQRTGALIRFIFEADGFLYHMVRNMVGTLIDVGRGRLPPEALREILESKDRRKAGRTAPACGLMLLDVTY